MEYCIKCGKKMYRCKTCVRPIFLCENGHYYYADTGKWDDPSE